MTAHRFNVSTSVVPQIENKEDGIIELWFVAYDDQGVEQDVFVELPGRIFPRFRAAVMATEVGGMFSSDLIANDPELGVRVLEKAFDMSGDVVNAWDVLVAGIGRANAVELINEKLGKDKAHEIFKAVKGE